MRVLVTGGTGLLGKALTETCPRDSSLILLHLHPQSHQPTGTNELLGDVRDRDEMRRIFGSQEFEVVIHAAGLSNVDYVERHYREAVESNITFCLILIAMSTISSKSCCW